MRELDFTARGLSESDLRRRSITRPSTTHLLAIAAVAAAVVYCLNRPGRIAITSPISGTSTNRALVRVGGTVDHLRQGDKPIAQIPGTKTTIEAKSVLVLADDSGSMADLIETRDAMIRTLEESGVEVHVVKVGTGGVSGVDGEIVRAIKDQFENGQARFDTVYLFSDFEERGDHHGVDQLREFLIRKRLRLYVGSVEHDPIQELTWLAEDSGGEQVEQMREDGE